VRILQEARRTLKRKCQPEKVLKGKFLASFGGRLLWFVVQSFSRMKSFPLLRFLQMGTWMGPQWHRLLSGRDNVGAATLTTVVEAKWFQKCALRSGPIA
jgi:hypothetical protein